MNEVELTGWQPRRSDLARGIVIARSARALDDAAQRAMWIALSDAGITERDEGDADPDDAGLEPARVWHAAPWLPPSPLELEAQRGILEEVARTYDLAAIWFVKVETGIDGVAWLEVAAAAREADEDDADDPEPPSPAVSQPLPMMGASESGQSEVIYSAPDAPTLELAAIPEEDEPEEDDDGDADEPAPGGTGVLESHWRNGTPPFEQTVAFPIEGYPEIIDEYDWERFGVALKLAGDATTLGPGAESVINAFFALWLSVYQDERAEEFEPFQRADVVHDRRHRSALMWVERFVVPATATDQVHFLLWILARIHDILPLAWARFDHIDDSVKARASGDVLGEPFVLAGNPFSDRFTRHGEDSALAWAVAQSAWSKRELSGMLVEVALDHDPDDRAGSRIAERLLRRAIAFEPRSDASGYLAIVLVRQRRLAEAIALAERAPSRDVRLLVIGEVAEHAPAELAEALALFDPETADSIDPEDLAELVASVARHAPTFLDDVLARLPRRESLVPYLYNTSFAVDRPQALAILRTVLALPEPGPDAGEARTALVMAWNNACIHAHALGDYRLAVELANGGQRFAPENPYIYHSAACAYAAVGEIDRALEQVAQAIENDYEHAEKMETDNDLAPLHADPRFPALFVEWRTRRADLN